MIIVIMTYKTCRMTDWNFDLNKKLVRYIRQNNISYWKSQAPHRKQFKTTAGWGKIKTVGYITPTMNHYPKNGLMGDADPRSTV